MVLERTAIPAERFSGLDWEISLLLTTKFREFFPFFVSVFYFLFFSFPFFVSVSFFLCPIFSPIFFVFILFKLYRA